MKEPWQHEWSRNAIPDAEGVPVKFCLRDKCPWEMLSHKGSNRYRNGPDGKWMHAPKDCDGRTT